MTTYLKLTNVYINPDRQRKDFDETYIEELADSIADKGLLHAPVIHIHPEYRETLVAGECRLRAIQKLHDEKRLFSYNGEVVKPGETPVTIVKDLDPIRIEEAELEENVKRRDLTWQERTNAYARLHEMRLKENPKQTFGKTAEEIVKSAGGHKMAVTNEISQATILAKHLDDPQVAKARSSKEAYSLVRRKLQNEFTAELARRAPVDTPHTLIHGDFREVDWSELGSFECIIADPPYGQNAADFGDAAKLTHEYDDTLEYALELSKRVIDLSCSLLKRNGVAYIFCDIDLFVILRDYATDKDLNPLRTPLIWNKGGGMGHIVTSGGTFGIRRSYENILMIFEGKKLTTETCSDVLPCPPVRDKEHAAQKPVDLYARLMTLATLPGARVLDPCCGSGTIFKAASKAHMNAVGIEKSESYHSVAAAALREGVL